MKSQKIIHAHDAWRRKKGGAPAGLAGEADAFSYAGLDLNLATFATTVFAGSTFTDTTFQKASWTDCTFTGCIFSQCDFEQIAISGCTFDQCTFSRGTFARSRLTQCRFTNCTWENLNFDHAQWSDVAVLDCHGSHIDGDRLQGAGVDWTGSFFEHLEFSGAQIN